MTNVEHYYYNLFHKSLKATDFCIMKCHSEKWSRDILLEKETDVFWLEKDILWNRVILKFYKS